MGNSISTRRAAGALAVLSCLLVTARGARAQGVDTSGFAGQVFQLINQQRADNGLPGLRDSPALDSSAQSYADVMKQATAGGPVFLSHTGPDGSTFEDRINAAGYSGWTTVGENIAAGQKSPQEVVDAWMNSAGHRANILDPQYQDMGIGIAVGPGTWSNGFTDPNVIWWVTDFGASRESASVGGATTGASTTGGSTTGGSTSGGSPTGASPTGASTTTGGSTTGTSTTGASATSASTTGASTTTGTATLPGGNPQPASVVNPAPALPGTSGRTLTVTAFGARGDGSTNDSPAIQAAVAAAQPGDSLYFPAGTYRLATPIRISTSGLTLRGDGITSVIQHGKQTAIQLDPGTGTLTGVGVKALRLVGAPGQYRVDGNIAPAIAISNGQASLVQDCEFDGPGAAIADTGNPGRIAGTWVINCRVNGWGSAGLVLNSGARVENCYFVQDDPDTSATHSGTGIVLPSGSSDVQIIGTTVANARELGIQIGGDGGSGLITGIQLQRVTAQNCRAGIAVGGGVSNPAAIQNILIEASTLQGTYGGPALSVKQGNSVEIRDNAIDGGPAGIALGLWSPAEPNQSISNLRAENNSVRNCDRGIWALAANGGSFTGVSLTGNTITNCRVPVDLGGAPGVSLSTAPALPGAPAGGPAIGWLANGLQDPITTIQTGHHFLIRGQGFGANGTGTSRVLFLIGAAQITGQTFLWSDDTIGVVAPIYPGAVQVVVQTETNGTVTTSNSAPLVVQ